MLGIGLRQPSERGSIVRARTHARIVVGGRENAPDAGFPKNLERRIDAVDSTDQPDVHDGKVRAFRFREAQCLLGAIGDARDLISRFHQHRLDLARREKVVLHNENFRSVRGDLPGRSILRREDGSRARASALCVSRSAVRSSACSICMLFLTR